MTLIRPTEILHIFVLNRIRNINSCALPTSSAIILNPMKMQSNKILIFCRLFEAINFKTNETILLQLIIKLSKHQLYATANNKIDKNNNLMIIAKGDWTIKQLLLPNINIFFSSNSPAIITILLNNGIVQVSSTIDTHSSAGK